MVGGMTHSPLLIVATAIALAGCATTQPATTAPVTKATTTAERAAPHPKGDSKLQCDYTLELNGSNPNYHFIAGGTLRNTGNVGIVMRVTYKWRMLGSGSVTEHHRYRVRAGQSRDVDVRIPATSDQIDAHQSAGSKCSTVVHIVDVFR